MVLTVVISLIVLFCSLATWPSLERVLLANMKQAISETANYREPDPESSLQARRSIHLVQQKAGF